MTSPISLAVYSSALSSGCPYVSAVIATDACPNCLLTMCNRTPTANAKAVIVAGAIVIPRLRPKILLGAGAAAFVTAVTVAFLIPSVWCSARGPAGQAFAQISRLWRRILVACAGLVVGLILASFARDKPDRGHRAVGFSEGPETARDQFPAGSPEREGASATEDASAPFSSHRRFSSSRSIPTSTARRV
jgi:hypothetical protein